MAIIGVTADPVIPSSVARPSFVLDYDEVYGDALQLHCAASQIEAAFATEFRSLGTFCGPSDEVPVEGTRGFDVTAFLSFGDGQTTNPYGLYTVLAAKALKRVKFAACMNGDAAVSVTNPEVSGEVWVPTIPPFNAPNPTDPVAISFNLRVYQALTTADAPAGAIMTHPLGPLTT